MWNKINSEYFIKFEKHEKDIIILLSNFIDIYYIRLKEEQFLQEIKDINPQLLEIDDFVLLQNVQQLLQDPACDNETNVSLLPNDILSVNIVRSVSLGFPLKLKLSLSEGSRETFFSHVTAPLLKVVHELKNGQNELCTFLVQKDKEIAEYREEGARLYYEHIKRLNALFRSPEFNYEKYKAQDTALAKLFKNDDILKSVLKKITDQEAHISLREKQNIDVTNLPTSSSSLLPHKVKEEVTSTSTNSMINGQPSSTECVESATHSTPVINVQSMKEESDTARTPLKRELTEPVSSAFSSVTIKEENKSNIIVKKKPKKLFNL